MSKASNRFQQRSPAGRLLSHPASLPSYEQRQPRFQRERFSEKVCRAAMVAIASRPRRQGIQHFCEFHLDDEALCAALIRLSDLKVLEPEGEALASEIEATKDSAKIALSLSSQERSNIASLIGQGCHRLSLRPIQDPIIGLSRI